jgi:hypothetical protein
MQFTVELPDDLAGQVIPAGSDPARAALEGMAVKAYRAGLAFRVPARYRFKDGSVRA